MRDKFTIYAKGGDGGSGCNSSHRSRHDRRGRPDGGNGGRGGDVILECSSSVWDFGGLQHHANAKKGGHGASKNMIGTRGDDKVVQVPVGTVIHLVQGELPTRTVFSSDKHLDPWDLPGDLECEPIKHDDTASAKRIGDSSYSGSVIELTEPGQKLKVAAGGEGGSGSVTLSTEETPSSSSGTCGSEAVLVLELKSIADVGLVGMPNAGKSTLLGALSRAKPLVGHYAFTTLRPNLGKLSFSDCSITIADIPGLIKGAHENRGLGLSFLRHIERTKVLAYVVDLAAALDGRVGNPAWVQLRDLVLELEHHQRGMSNRPSLVVANKIDEDGADHVLSELKRRVPRVQVFPVCAVLEEGIPELKDGLRMLVDSQGCAPLTLDGIDCS